MGRMIASALTRCLLCSPAILVAAFAACGGSGKATGGTGTGGTAASASVTGSTSNTGGTSSVGSTSSSGLGFTTGTASGGTGGGAMDGGCGTTVVSECKTDADCDDGDPTTADSCVVMDPQSEFPSGTCLHVACDGSASCSMQAVDPECSVADAGVTSPPFVALTPPDVPASCANGFQVCDAQGAAPYVVHAVPAAGSRALTLDLDFATYTAPDGLLITGVDGMCKKYVLFDSCRISTAPSAEGAYTDGMHRPQDVAIRQFHLTLRPGTSQLTFDFSRVVSPMYFQILGLCDFSLPPAPGVGWFSPVP